MNVTTKETIKVARKTLNFYIDFLDRILKDLNRSDDEKIGRAVLAITCIHVYFNQRFKEDMEKMIQDFLATQSH